MRITVGHLKQVISEAIAAERPMSDEERHERIGYGFLGTVAQDQPDVDADMAYDAALDAVAGTLNVQFDDAQRILDSNLGRHLADGLGVVDPMNIYGSVYDSVSAQAAKRSFRRDAVRAMSSGR